MIFVVVQALLLVAKLCHLIDWNWLLVLLPMELTVLFSAFWLIVAVACAIISAEYR